MTFTERYKNGETTSVYSDIAKLGQAAFSQKHLTDIEAVLTETMERTAHNLAVIYDELQRVNYNFKREIKYSFEAPLNKPLVNTDKLLVKLDKAVKPIGAVPLSLKFFYKIVGSCNFAWDYETDANILWEGGDPIQIVPLDDLVEEVTGEDWQDEMEENKEVDGSSYLQLSADYLHKDNISGGPAYSIEVTANPSIDGKLLNEEHETTFVDYLRISFENCGFSRADALERIPSFEEFCDQVGPKLKKL